ncbi:hypothetical protein B0675_25745 [Streptomyces sp. M41(2017)]|nr:hypothetical protein B0675_25745 [Streptomyces sp. M41(2017)]
MVVAQGRGVGVVVPHGGAAVLVDVVARVQAGAGVERTVARPSRRWWSKVQVRPSSCVRVQPSRFTPWRRE